MIIHTVCKHFKGDVLVVVVVVFFFFFVCAPLGCSIMYRSSTLFKAIFVQKATE